MDHVHEGSWEAQTANPAEVTFLPAPERPLCSSCGADYLSPLEWGACEDCLPPEAI